MPIKNLFDIESVENLLKIGTSRKKFDIRIWMDTIIYRINDIIRKKIRLLWLEEVKKGFIYSFILHLILSISIQIILVAGGISSKRIRLIKSKAPIPVFLQEVISEKSKKDKIFYGKASADTVSPIQNAPENLFAGYEIDTSSIIQKYEESTLNVSILFPVNWVFYDNKVKDIIDGIIFLPGPGSDYNPQLSVLIQIVNNKSLFNRTNYDSSFVYNNMEFFIGKKKITFGQVTQSIYVKTNIFKADFMIKCTSPNETEFNKFQPVFFAMVKTFSAGY